MGKLFSAREKVTPKLKSDLARIQTRPRFYACLGTSLMNIQSKRKAISCPQHYFPALKGWLLQVNGRMWLEFELVRDFTPVQVTCNSMIIRSKMKSLSCPQHLVHYKPMGKCFDAQRHVHVTMNQSLIWQEVNSSKILCLS